MRIALALAVFLPVAASAQSPSPAGLAYRECVEAAAVRYAHAAGSVEEAVAIAFTACIKERDTYLGTRPPNEAWPLTVQTIRDHLIILVAEERLKRAP